jgi:hypothetical protein
MNDVHPGLSWRQYLEQLVAEHGSFAAIALKLSVSDGGETDLASVERALRRLRTKEHQDGGQYGVRLLRVFGISKAIEQRVKWMGVYHSRFADLPVSLCLDQLRMLNRPPLSESKARTWIELGFATCALRSGELESAAVHLQNARGGHLSVASRIEALLLEAFIGSRLHDYLRTARALAEAEPWLKHAELEPHERTCLKARWHDQMGYALSHPPADSSPNLEGAKMHYEQISINVSTLFASCKRDSGLAYVYSRLGDMPRAIQHATAACEHAGDGGFVRLRIAYLGQLARLLGGAAGNIVRERAIASARALEDEELITRIGRK